jgi:hypothetical protein
MDEEDKCKKVSNRFQKKWEKKLQDIQKSKQQTQKIADIELVLELFT